MRVLWPIVCAALVLAPAHRGLADVTPSPYVDIASRPIKALSADEILSLKEGRGMGLALAAELNRHPGPKHVLELSDSLQLTPEQQRRTRDAFETMHRAAVALGEQIIEREKSLDQLFASGPIDDEKLAHTVDGIADLQGRLRYTHLRAHLKMMEILTDEQVTRYTALRGYATPHNGACPHAAAGASKH